MSKFQNHNRRRATLLSLVALFFLLSLGACKSNESAPDSAQKDGAEAAAEAPKEEAKDDKKVVDAPPGDIYPGMNLGMLPDAKRATVVEITEAELCPCEDSTESLHACLQDADKACALAKQVANTVVRGVHAGAPKSEIQDVIAQFVTNAKKIHTFDLKGVPSKGNKEASVAIVEFADFQCPHCKVASGILDEISKEYGDKIVVYFKQFPLNAHNQSMSAAVATLAAHNQDKFWPMHDLVFENQRSLAADSYEKFAGRIGLNMAKFKTDLKSPMIAGAITRDRQEGEAAGLTGTPTLYINGRQYQGGIDKAAIIAAIEAELEAVKSAEAEKATE